MARLERVESDYRREALRRIEAARANVARIVMAAAREKGLKITGRNRDKLYALIDGEYAKLEVGLRDWSRELVGQGVLTGMEEAAKATDADAKKLTKFSKDFAERVFEIISPGNESQLAGVLTKKMCETDLSNLRKAQRDMERQAALEGWDSGRKVRELKSRWMELAGDMEEAHFTDASGRTWDTDTYLNMLVSTTAERTRREGFMEGLARNGDDLVRVAIVDGEACDVCEEWDGRILSISGADGRFPSYEDAVADGMFHPNCRCRLERVDQEWDAEEIEEQAEENAEREEEEEQTQEPTREGRTRLGGETGRKREEGTNGGATKRRSDEGTAGAKGRTAAPRQDSNGTGAVGTAKIRVGKHGKIQLRLPTWSEAGVTEATREKPIANALGDTERMFAGLQEALDNARARIVELPREEMATASKMLREQFWPHAEHPGSVAEENIVLPGKQAKEWETAKSFIERVVNQEYLGPKVSVATKHDISDGRAFYRNGKITLLDTDNASSMIHEFGHHLEDSNPNIRERCIEFLRHRADASTGWAAKARELRTILPGGGYRRGERAISDKFEDPYCGKVYLPHSQKQPFPLEKKTPYGIRKGFDVESTELLSMGLQKLYDDPVKFFEFEPEYYNFIVSLLSGAI